MQLKPTEMCYDANMLTCSNLSTENTKADQEGVVPTLGPMISYYHVCSHSIYSAHASRLACSILVC